MSKATFQFEGPTGTVTVGEELARVYRKTNGFSEIIPDAPEAEAPDASTLSDPSADEADTSTIGGTKAAPKNRSDR